MRFVFSPPAGEVAGLLSLPWALPLVNWRDERLVRIRQRGISRHVVRFVADDGGLYALKSLSETLARREYRLLRVLVDLGVPAVEVVGVVVDRGADQDAILVTRFLEYSSTYRALFSSRRGGLPTDSLLDSLVELLVRLHLSGFFWGDCSLSNALFRADAGTYQAYLVDAETSEQHPTLTDGQRAFDLEIAAERVCGELMDLQSGELLPEDVDPIEVSTDLVRRYEGLWEELNHDEIITPTDQRHRIAKRLRRLNELGYDADELELIDGTDGTRLRVRTKVAESGQSSRHLFRETGIIAEEHQARRLLNDIASFRAYKEQKLGHPVSEIVAAHRWLEEVYDPVVVAIPASLRGRLAPPEIFHEILEHRWYMSEAAGRDVGTTAAARSYFETVLPAVPQPISTRAEVDVAEFDSADG
jgi:tRNA A-37 threonylcarbamoyl transferase component Bud32